MLQCVADAPFDGTTPDAATGTVSVRSTKELLGMWGWTTCAETSEQQQQQQQQQQRHSRKRSIAEVEGDSGRDGQAEGARQSPQVKLLQKWSGVVQGAELSVSASSVAVALAATQEGIGAFFGDNSVYMKVLACGNYRDTTDQADSKTLCELNPDWLEELCAALAR
jgi:hypothetical protein